MTKREAAIVSAYTGYLIGDFSSLHKYAEEVMKGPVFTHQFGDDDFCDKLQFESKKDFVTMEVKG